MIKKWNIKPKRDYTNIYWFWQKYTFAKGEPTQAFTKVKFRDMINTLIEIILLEDEMQSNNYHGQSKAEYYKNYKRVNDIVAKSNGDESRGIALAKVQANRITDEYKAINRAMVAKELEQEHIFEVFFQRAYELGTVTKQDYRDYKLSKLGI